MPPKTISNNYLQGSLTSDPDRFSDSAWDLLLSSQDEAKRWRHGYLDVEHLFQVLFSNRAYKNSIESLTINHSELLNRLEGFLAKQPMSRGENLIIGDDLEDLLEIADDFRVRWGSRQIEISHLLIALGRDKRIGAKLFEELGLPSERLEAELQRTPIKAPRQFEQTASIKNKSNSSSTATTTDPATLNASISSSESSILEASTSQAVEDSLQIHNEKIDQ